MAPCHRATAHARARARSQRLLPLSCATATYGWKNGLHRRAHYEEKDLRPHRQDVRRLAEMMSMVKIWTGEVYDGNA